MEVWTLDWVACLGKVHLQVGLFLSVGTGSLREGLCLPGRQDSKMSKCQTEDTAMPSWCEMLPLHSVTPMVFSLQCCLPGKTHIIRKLQKEEVGHSRYRQTIVLSWCSPKASKL